MIGRQVAGVVPAKHHIAFRDASGALLYEECLTRDGFDGPYTILYHQGKPHTARVAPASHGWTLPVAAGVDRPLARRHYRSHDATASTPANAAPIDARVPLLFNDDVVIAIARPGASDPVCFVNADADDLHYIAEGQGTLRSLLGDIPFTAGDYVLIPRGVLHRFDLPPGMRQEWLSIECLGGVGLPRQWRNDVGQIRMDAPFSARDFRVPTFTGPCDDGIRDLVVKRDGHFHGFRFDHAQFDVVGWDGAVYPVAFPILAFQPRVGLVHLPPSGHGTFAARGALVCSFVPRPLDFHPDAIPCPYPHTSVHCDEVIFYCRGHFASRRGVGPGSLSHHPMGVAHGPHPGAYESSIGRRDTDELAVMLDTWKPLTATAAALATEDPGYHDSFVG